MFDRYLNRRDVSRSCHPLIRRKADDSRLSQDRSAFPGDARVYCCRNFTQSTIIGHAGSVESAVARCCHFERGGKESGARLKCGGRSFRPLDASRLRSGSDGGRSRHPSDHAHRRLEVDERHRTTRRARGNWTSRVTTKIVNRLSEPRRPSHNDCSFGCNVKRHVRVVDSLS